MKSYNIALIKGDGIGPEVIDEAKKVLDAVSQVYNFKIKYEEYLMGGCAYDAYKNPLPEITIQGCLKADAILFGAIGGSKWDNLPRELRPESGLLRLRKELEVFANIRPAIVFEELLEASTLKPEVIADTDLVIIRELISGIYFGKPRGKDQNHGYNTMAYTKKEIERIAKIGFQFAANRRKKLCSVDKANVLEVSQLWREVVTDVSKEYPEIELTHQYIDNASMQLIKDPRQFDVILTGNLFGDILSDEAGMLTGSIGLLPSASIGEKVALYEPIHGSAPDIAGMGIANPIAAILSASMLLKYTLKETQAAEAINQAVSKVLKKGCRTQDIAHFGAEKICSTSQMGDLITECLERG
ncbi:3-isopropylmalate dehydrogenase [Helicobacter sp. 12S02232-10]|uniref:3-isopropylmalate dehydrogenase n=1 Tax=Helicobacter sp. 12S02232-10 TaxID=1476197 RepID=UPI000BD11837|nr:3-isopropylmalate dehydrogenase [Helicobacter sp. 12S02232-10]PAF48949.1 3-isopropylmalate dehydrogenase [Helicobacter sp. 12S02232-10]